MTEVEDVEVVRPPSRLRKLRYVGDVTEAFNEHREADQPFGESGKGWPYRVLSVDYSPPGQSGGAPLVGVTTVTLEPYPVDAYMAWLERQRAAALAKRLANVTDDAR